MRLDSVLINININIIPTSIAIGRVIVITYMIKNTKNNFDLS
jgi:hypothetical protein